MASNMNRAMVLEGLSDYSDSLEDAILPGLVAAIAAAQPAWMRQAAREMAEYDDFDWAYEDWKMERANAFYEAQWESDMARMDDDGGPVFFDHHEVHWGLADHWGMRP